MPIWERIPLLGPGTCKSLIRALSSVAIGLCVQGCTGVSLEAPLTTAAVVGKSERTTCRPIENVRPSLVDDNGDQALDRGRGKSQTEGRAQWSSSVEKAGSSAASKTMEPGANDCVVSPAAKFTAPSKDRASDVGGGARPAGSAVGLNAELTIGFDSDNQSVSDHDRRRIIDAARAHVTSGHRHVRVLAGAGGKGNPFDQLVIAQRRARLIRTIFTAELVVSVEYDPIQTEDTVRIEFVRKS